LESDIKKDKSLNILIVDDEETITQILSNGFEDNGYTCYVARESDTALSIIKKYPIHFSLLDVRLQGKSGIEICKNIAQISPTTINIIMTGYPGVKSATEAMRTNAYDYLIKPFRVDLIFSVIERAMDEIRHQNFSNENSELVRSLREENEQLRKLVKDLSPGNSKSEVQYSTQKSREKEAEISYKKLIENPLRFGKKTK
tara:strand:+ start:5544 stop:6143 length:600 start_codon:yes stop_codon:yes gene_type:complete